MEALAHVEVLGMKLSGLCHLDGFFGLGAGDSRTL